MRVADVQLERARFEVQVTAARAEQVLYVRADILTGVQPPVAAEAIRGFMSGKYRFETNMDALSRYSRNILAEQLISYLEELG